MKISKAYRLCFSIGTFFSIIVLSMLILQIPEVAKLFSPTIVYSTAGTWLWVVLWLIIMLECAIIPGPYIPFLLFFATTPLATDRLLFWGVCTSAVIVGRVGAYFVGKFFGNKMLKWVAADSYVAWQTKLDGPAGRLFYAVTVAAPGFPDFVLALVAGSIGMNFWFYMLINSICKAIENVLLIYLGIVMGAGGNIWFYIYIGIAIVSLLAAIILKCIIKTKKLTDIE